MPISSMRTRMTLAFSAALFVFLAAACTALILYARREASMSATMLLSRAVHKVHHQLTDPDDNHDFSHLLDDDDDASRLNIAVLVVGTSGKVEYQSQKRVPTWPVRHDGEWRTRVIRTQGGTIVLGLPWRATSHRLRVEAAVLIILSLLILALSSLGAWMLVGRTLSPIHQLAGQADDASVHDLRVTLHPPSGDAELVELVATLNGLLGRVAETAETRGRFYAAASHELRTPLQALSGHLELALRKSRSVEEYRSVIGEASLQSQRLTRLVQDLLLLHQLEVGPSAPPETVYLSDVCRRIANQLQTLARSRSITLTMELNDDVSLVAPPMHVEMLVRNLLENAVKYADSGTVVRADLGMSPKSLMITNSAHGGLPVEPERLFEPFFRPDTSRSSETGGHGLGLAICKAIADVNGWQVSLSASGGQVCATIRFNTETPTAH
ncbi:MAG: hypothetical protein KGJ62_11445 [Armatimonadetes bacterium]|nr:hypothetical protein [Armatimonadota bacterium]MDE2206475.1 hypothetical protein [Armatimonadota bacterium]